MSQPEQNDQQGKQTEHLSKAEQIVMAVDQIRVFGAMYEQEQRQARLAEMYRREGVCIALHCLESCQEKGKAG